MVVRAKRIQHLFANLYRTVCVVFVVAWCPHEVFILKSQCRLCTQTHTGHAQLAGGCYTHIYTQELAGKKRKGGWKQPMDRRATGHSDKGMLQCVWVSAEPVNI